jgi:hypothetical protein
MQYHADPCPEPSLSASLALRARDVDAGTRSALHPRLNPAAVAHQAEHFDIGTVAHAAFLEGRDVVAILEFDDFRTKDARAARDARARRRQACRSSARCGPTSRRC